MSFQRKKYCQIKSCPNNRGTLDRTFRLPRCNSSIRDKWVQAIKGNDPGFRAQISQFVSVCQRHFDSDDIYVSSKNGVAKLKPGAFPKNFVDPLEVEIRSNDILAETECSTSPQSPQNSVRLVKIVVKKNTDAEKVATCTGCLKSDTEMQTTRQRIAEVDNELAEQRNEINYLKKSIKFMSKPRLQVGICELCQNRLPTEELDTHFCINNNGQTGIQCGYCSSMFKSTFKLLEHLKVFHDDKTFVECNQCDAKFEMDALLEVHKTTIHQNDVDGLDCNLHVWKKDQTSSSSSDGYQCGSCGQIFQTARILRSHKKRHHLNVELKEKLFECYVCKEPMSSLYNVRYHLANSHRSSTRCALCKCLLDDYQIKHHLCRLDDDFVKCDYCPRKFLCVIDILKHLENDHEHTKTAHQCNACNKYYYMKLLLDYHSIYHETNEKSHICYICGKFFSADQLSVHIRRVHTMGKSFLCVHCGSAFKGRSQLKIHLESHADRTMQCDQCPMLFRCQRTLNNHKQQHSNINYVCGTCNVELKTKFSFRCHMRKHNGQTEKRNHECSICFSKFLSRHDLIKHTRMHTKEKPIQCEYCDSKFRYKNSLKLHLRSHFGEKIYSCKKPDCDKRFRFAKELQEHSAEHYKSEMEALNIDDSVTVDV